MPRLIPCAGGIVFDASGRLLLIQRGTPPAAGSWSVPGGRCGPDENPEQACVREVAEETGLRVAVSRWAGTVRRDAVDGDVYEIDDYVCTLLGGTPVAGDDAAQVRWVTRDALETLPLAPLLFETLREWDCLPRC